MTMTAASVLIPLQIVSSMILPGTTIAEPDVSLGESLWVSGGTYEVDDEKVSDHIVWSCVQDHTGRTIKPTDGDGYWLKKRPSNLFAPFDQYISTPAKATGSLTYLMQPGFYTDVSVYGATGDRVVMEAYESPEALAGDEEPMATVDEDLWEQAIGLYELLFSPLGRRSKVQLDNIPLSPTGVLKVTISADPAAQVSMGSLIIGEWRSLVGSSPQGGTEFGAECEPKSFSYIKSYDDGTFEIKRRHSATDLNFSIVMDADQAEYVVATVQQIQDMPVAIRATNVPGYGYLNTVGLVSCVVRAKNTKEATGSVRVKGVI